MLSLRRGLRERLLGESSRSKRVSVWAEDAASAPQEFAALLRELAQSDSMELAIWDRAPQLAQALIELDLPRAAAASEQVVRVPFASLARVLDRLSPFSFGGRLPDAGMEVVFSIYDDNIELSAELGGVELVHAVQAAGARAGVLKDSD